MIYYITVKTWMGLTTRRLNEQPSFTIQKDEVHSMHATVINMPI